VEANNTKIEKQIQAIKKILDGLEIVFDHRTPQFGESSKDDLMDLRHRAIFVHAEIADGMTFTILRYLYPKGIVIRDKPLTGQQMARAEFINRNFIVKLSFTRKLEVFSDLQEYYMFDKDLFRLIRRVNDIRNDFAHPSWNSLGKYASFRQLHKAYRDLLEGIQAFKIAIEKVKDKSQNLDEN